MKEDAHSSKNSQEEGENSRQPLRLSVFLIVIGVFGVINLVLYLGSEFGHGAEKKELEELKIKLNELKLQAETLEPKIRSAEENVKTAEVLVNRCKTRIIEFEKQAVNGGLPSPIYFQYTTTVDNCNNQINNYSNLFNYYKTIYIQYDQAIELHNSIVPRANMLAKTIGTKYYIIPVPRFRHAH